MANEFFYLSVSCLPKEHRYAWDLENGNELFIGESGRICRKTEPKYFRTAKEAELFADAYIKDKGPAYDFALVQVQRFKRRSGEAILPEQFTDKNYYLKVIKASDRLFVGRESLRTHFDSGKLVVGRGSALAKFGKQAWFQTHAEAEKKRQKLRNSPAFAGCDFEIVFSGE